uniref:Uncharacterized protein n=1 Tax=Gadus morhua TaxID=8049 RepID=A0A8C5C5C4_GADMO
MRVYTASNRLGLNVACRYTSVREGKGVSKEKDPPTSPRLELMFLQLVDLHLKTQKQKAPRKSRLLTHKALLLRVPQWGCSHAIGHQRKERFLNLPSNSWM